MALERGKLRDVVQVAADSSETLITVADNKKVYVKSIICHNPGIGIQTGTCQLYFVPNGGSSGAANRIFDVDVEKGETILIEPSYPLVLDSTGDSLRAESTPNVVGFAATDINVLIIGDKEA